MKNLVKKIIFLDTETTGVNTEDRLFQVAYDFNGHQESELFLPPLPICIEASETTHYTNEDVKDKQPFLESTFKNKLKEILSNNEIIFIAHNAKFDIEMLKKEGIEVFSFIDTLKIAQYLDCDAKLNAYRLQYLRYALKLDVGKIPAHDALGDVIVLKALFERLYTKMSSQTTNPNNILNEMIEISLKPTLIKKFTFGKHIGELVETIAQKDKGYLEWLLKQKHQQAAEGDIDENWIFTLKTYLD
ncbi:MAG: hypothetical protein KAI16_02005 [Candidatus Pacebacteria bacterium]|nr:hypothetical protein [Candidatus Paceibacterota bacterium]